MSTEMPHVVVTSPFWRRYRTLIKDVVLPYQWDVLNDAIKIELPDDPGGNQEEMTHSGAIENLRIAAGRSTGEFSGFLFQDSDVYKWLEAVAYVLMYDDAPELRAHADEVIGLIAEAQMEDGYLNSFFQINGLERRFKRLSQSHELYVMGHYIEAGIAYWEATGSTLALDIARRMADCIDANFGPEDGKLHGGDGHPEIELALARLFEATGEKRYLELAQWFVLVRGEDPDFYNRQNAADDENGEFFAGLQYLMKSGSYMQADKPFLEQTEVNGHAVRAGYLLTGAAHIAGLIRDRRMLDAVRRLWYDVAHRRMYITGNVGSTQVGESFTYDYDLPNDTMYGETCASVSMAFLARRMLEIDARAEYGEVLERELFNGAIAGMSLGGHHFYYVNPLEEDPIASERNPGKRHILPHRAQWFGCACCPANLARLIASVDRYIYTERDEGRTVLMHQFIASDATFASGVTVSQVSNYPWDGDVTVRVGNAGEEDVQLGIRIPAWAYSGVRFVVEGWDEVPNVQDGFAYIPVPAGEERSISFSLPFSPQCMRASSRVAADAGKVAVMRGPLVDCMESADNPGPLWNYQLDMDSLVATDAIDVLGGMAQVKAKGLQAVEDPDDGHLYRRAGSLRWKEAELTFIPYFMWANREVGQMRVWVRPTDSRAS